MSLLTNINGIPLFSTIQEALSWAQSNGLEGSHTHTFNGQTGYMGGISHNAATAPKVLYELPSHNIPISPSANIPAAPAPLPPTANNNLPASSPGYSGTNNTGY
jgi:hypothetical protein